MQRAGLLSALGLSLTGLGCPADTIDSIDSTTSPTTGVVADDDGSTSGTPLTTGVIDDGEASTDDGPETTDDSSGGPAPDPVCGNAVVERDEDCDGDNLDEQTCMTQGFDGGDLGCEDDCRHFDTSGCWFDFCGNGSIQGDEVCDLTATGDETCITQGFESGTLTCNANCTDYDTSTCGMCGDLEINGDEDCEGAALGNNDCVDLGFEGGTLGCQANCAFDTSDCSMCGDGAATGFEPCDGADLGGETCASLGLTGGNLGCAAGCIYDFSGCDIQGIPFGSDTGYNGFELNAGGALPCDDISGTGTATALGDDEVVSVPIGFSFTFYGVQYTDATINSNGSLRFGDAGEHGLANSCLPTTSASTTNAIFAFWDDLDPGEAGAEVRYQTLGPVGDQRFVVQWDTPHYPGGGDYIRFQVMLREAGGRVDVCYPDVTSVGNAGDLGAEATSGIQQDANNGFEYSCDMPDLYDGLQLFYLPT